MFVLDEKDWDAAFGTPTPKQKNGRRLCDYCDIELCEELDKNWSKDRWLDSVCSGCRRKLEKAARL